MPTRNIYFFIATVCIALFISSKTSLKEQILTQVANQLENNCLTPPSRDSLLQGALKGMADAVGDEPYTAYIPPSQQEDYMREIQGQYAGVGLGEFIRDERNGGFYFVPLYNSPALKAGLKFGDRIVAVDDNDITTSSLVDVMGLLRGKEGTSVRIKVVPRSSNPDFLSPNASSEDDAQTNDGADEIETREITVVRDIVRQDPITGDRLDSNGRWVFTLAERPEIGYIRVESFIDDTGHKTREALAQLEKNGVTKIILDFRGNPGGFLPDAVEICNEFLSHGSPIVETRNRKGVKERYIADKYPRKRFQVAVLIDENSASASEIVSAALQDAGVAVVVGVRSYGKGTVQNIFELPYNFGVLRMTTSSFWRPSGAPIHRLKDSTPEDEWGVVPNEGCEIPVSHAQKFFSNLVRQTRSVDAEGSETSFRSIPFITKRTNCILDSLFKEKGLKQLEAAFELGIDASQIEEEKERLSANEKENVDFKFVPQGNAPYYDPQLDCAIEKLLEER